MSLCAVYTRLSIEDKDKHNPVSDSDSIINQKRLILDYIIENNMEIYKVYSDEDYSGASKNRPDFQRLIEDAKLKKFDTVLCKTQSRFTRELELVEKYINGLFVELGIRFIAVAENIDTSVCANRKSLQINGLVNEWYLEDLSENVKTTMNNLRRQGKCVSSFVCYGYKKNSVNKHKLLIDQEAANIVKRIFNMYLDGQGLMLIARVLNKEGILTPTQYREECGSKYKNANAQKNAFWTSSTVNYILNNETYTGCLIQGKKEKASYKEEMFRKKKKEDWIRIEGMHDVIISKHDFEKVQQMKCRKNISKKNEKKHILFNKLKCMSCGNSLEKKLNRNKVYFNCKTVHHDKTICDGVHISFTMLEIMVLSEFRELFEKYVGDEKDISNITDKKKKERLYFLKKEIYSLQEQINALSTEKKEIYLLKVQEIFTVDEYHRRTRALDYKIKDLNSRQSKLNAICSTLEKENFLVNVALDYKDIQSLNEVFIKQFIDYIEVGKSHKGKVIKIHWLF